MADNDNTATHACAACGKTATTYCAACDEQEHNGGRPPSFYCGSACQALHRSSHKWDCQPAVAHKKLFRAGELMQEAFLAICVEIFDMDIAKVERDRDGKLHLFKGTILDPLKVIQPATTWMSGDPEVKRAVLSYLAGGDAFSNAGYDLGVNAFKVYVAKIEEVDVRIFESRVLIRYYPKGTASAASNNLHHVLCVTLKDGTAWVVDPAGAQHGQLKPVLAFADYSRDYIAKVLDRRPYGANERTPEKFVYERHARNGAANMMIAFLLDQSLEYVADELAEWQSALVSAADIVKAKTADYQRLKSLLVAHLAEAAREYIKFANRDPTSTAKPIVVCDTTLEGLSPAEKARAERKKARHLASMTPSERATLEEAAAEGNHVMII